MHEQRQAGGEYNGNALVVDRADLYGGAGTAGIGFDTDGNLDFTALDTFLSADTYGRVARWHNQVGFAASDAVADTITATTGDTAVGSNVITNVAGVGYVQIGMSLAAPGFPDGSRVTHVDVGARAITVFDFATATTTGVTLLFQEADQPRIGTGTAPVGPIAIGANRALIFEGASQSGRVYRLNISNLNMTARDYTVFMVVRPTTSTYRTQGAAAPI